MKHRIKKRMYAVSCDGIGLIAGTMAYSRANAICHFLSSQAGEYEKEDWQNFKADGYRTVKAMVQVLTR